MGERPQRQSPLQPQVPWPTRDRSGVETGLEKGAIRSARPSGSLGCVCDSRGSSVGTLSPLHCRPKVSRAQLKLLHSQAVP